jgi:hypothetical protein
MKHLRNELEQKIAELNDTKISIEKEKDEICKKFEQEFQNKDQASMENLEKCNILEAKIEELNSALTFSASSSRDFILSSLDCD